MILAIDIGNTNIVIGCIDGEKVCFVERASTNLAKTELEYVVEFRTLFELYHIGMEDITGSIISSVVPPLNNIIKSGLEKMFHQAPMVVGPGVKTGTISMTITIRRADVADPDDRCYGQIPRTIPAIPDCTPSTDRRCRRVYRRSRCRGRLLATPERS